MKPKIVFIPTHWYLSNPVFFSVAKEFKLYKDYVSISIEFNGRYVDKFFHDEKIILDVAIDKFFKK